MNDARVRPAAIELDRAIELKIRWADGHESVYPLVLLRKMCPCAVCRHEREETSRPALRVLSKPIDVAAMTTAANIELVGHYAIRLAWADGHDVGIFDFVMLRGVCPCEQCRAGQKEA